jgi:hypothetical protein
MYYADLGARFLGTGSTQMKCGHVVVLLTWLTGCAMTPGPVGAPAFGESAILTGRPKAPHRGKVHMLMEGEPIPSTFEEIAIIQMMGTFEKGDPELVLDALKKMAARLGCNMIIRTRIDHGNVGAFATAVCIHRAPDRTVTHHDAGTSSDLGPSQPTSTDSDGDGHLSGRDELSLKTGETIPGTIVAIDPGRHVVILEAKTQAPQKVLWYRVKAVKRGTPPAPVDEPQTPPSKTADCTQPIPGRVDVHIEVADPIGQPQNLQLHRWLLTSVPQMPNTVVGMNNHEFICRAPCDKVVDGRMGQEYFFTGDGISDSSRFQLINQSGHVSVRVRPGRYIAPSTKAWVNFAGVMTWTPGIALAVTAALNDDPSVPHIVSGVGLTASGATLLLTGLILQLITRDTKYTFVTPARKTSHPHTQLEGWAWRF